MRVLLDTNILVRAAIPSDPLSTIARAATARLVALDRDLCAVPQVFCEFYVVATRPRAQNGLALSPALAHALLRDFETALMLLPDAPEVYPQWRELVRVHEVLGKSAHDARLVAAMSVHGVDAILTFNGDDFRRFPTITVMEPRAVASE